MKRFLCLALALCMVLGLCGCRFITREIIERDVTDTDNETLYEHGMELGGLLEEMLGSDQYLQLMSGSAEINAVLQPYKHADFSEPESVYRVTPSEDVIPILMGMSEVDLDDFSEPLQEYLERRVISTLPTTINAQGGSSVLAAASICTVSDVWAGAGLEDDCYLLYFYPEACPIMVTFHGGESYIDGSAMLLLADNVTEDSLEDVTELFQQLGIDCDVEELEIDND